MGNSKQSNIGRRNFLGTISKASALGSLGLLPAPLFAKEKTRSANPAEAEHVFLTRPYLQAINSAETSIRWITNRPSYSWVEYGEGSTLDQKMHHVSDGLVHAYNRVHEVVLRGLAPGKKYKYRVASKDILEFQPYKLTYGETIYSDEFSFTTPDPKANEVSWLVLNDIHDRPASFAQLLKLNHDPYDFVFLNGDMFDYQTDEKQLLDHLLVPCSDSFASQRPFMFVRGNHETRGKFARSIKEYFTNPGQQYFTFRYGPVFAIALDTGEDKEDAHPVYAGIVDFDGFREAQAQWLERQMQSKEFKKAKYKVVLMHIPPFYSGEAHGTMHCRKVFAPLFDKYKVDVVIAGHTHTYGIHPPVAGQHNYPIIIGGGPREGKRTLIKVKANEQSLDVQMLRDDGAEVGKYTIKQHG